MSKPVWVLFGATASGKSDLALILAEMAELEIICMDAFQVYKHIPIMAASPTLEAMRKVPHHLFAHKEPDEDYSLAEWYEDAVNVIRQVWTRKRIPLLVGGTGLYLRTIQEGLTQSPPPDKVLRSHLEQRGIAEGSQQLHRELSTLWPQRAQQLHPNDLKRIVRALEIAASARNGIQGQIVNTLAEDSCEFSKIWLNPARELLYDRINTRVLAMVASGLIAEVAQLKQYAVEGKTITQAIGYLEAMTYLQGRISEKEMVECIQTKTRQFAKRQLTWFRAQPDSCSFSSCSVRPQTQQITRPNGKPGLHISMNQESCLLPLWE